LRFQPIYCHEFYGPQWIFALHSSSIQSSWSSNLSCWTIFLCTIFRTYSTQEFCLLASLRLHSTFWCHTSLRTHRSWCPPQVTTVFYLLYLQLNFVAYLLIFISIFILFHKYFQIENYFNLLFITS
jgi:hypothetical protein